MNNKGADQTAQISRLVCAFVVGKPLKTGFLESRHICGLGGKLNSIQDIKPYMNGKRVWHIPRGPIVIVK